MVAQTLLQVKYWGLPELTDLSMHPYSASVGLGRPRSPPMRDPVLLQAMRAGGYGRPASGLLQAMQEGPWDRAGRLPAQWCWGAVLSASQRISPLPPQPLAVGRGSSPPIQAALQQPRVTLSHTRLGGEGMGDVGGVQGPGLDLGLPMLLGLAGGAGPQLLQLARLDLGLERLTGLGQLGTWCPAVQVSIVVYLS